MSRQITRRHFLKTAGVAASATLVGESLIGNSAAQAASSYVRRDIGLLVTNDPIITSYRAAVKAMKALPATDPRSWTYQAAIHGTTTTPVQTAWKTCEHGTYFFWSWHRMYLYWFERIVRKLSNDSCWALPYWNWSAASERQLPAAFRDTASELYTSNRNSAMNSGAGSLPASYVDYSSSFAMVSFTSASSSIEGTPHGAVHVGVGGWMGSVPTAGQDPIFYLHHCNIDRLWNLWLAQGGGRSDPTGDSTWTGKKFTFFDENGNSVQMTGCEVLRAAQQLNYVYEGEPTQVNQYCLPKIKLPPFIFVRKELLRFPIPPIVLESKPVSFPMELKPLRQQLTALADSKTDTVMLALDAVEADRQPGVVWEVYVGLPANTAADTKSPHYVGNIALFGAGVRSDAHHEFKPARFDFPINRAIALAFKGGQETVPVTLAPSGILVDGKPSQPKVASRVRIGSVSLVVESQKRQ